MHQLFKLIRKTRVCPQCKMPWDTPIKSSALILFCAIPAAARAHPPAGASAVSTALLGGDTHDVDGGPLFASLAVIAGHAPVTPAQHAGLVADRVTVSAGGSAPCAAA